MRAQSANSGCGEGGELRFGAEDIFRLVGIFATIVAADVLWKSEEYHKAPGACRRVSNCCPMLPGRVGQALAPPLSLRLSFASGAFGVEGVALVVEVFQPFCARVVAVHRLSAEDFEEFLSCRVRRCCRGGFHQLSLLRLPEIKE